MAPDVGACSFRAAAAPVHAFSVPRGTAQAPGVNEDHPALVRRLLAPKSWPEAPSPPELIETHISWVILAGERAYKIKKPVLLSFVDFRTLEARKAACLEELRLNRRLAPEIYEAVVPIGGTVDEPLLGAEPAIEYAVMMRRFPQSALLDARLAAGRLGPKDMRQAARMVAAFHRCAGSTSSTKRLSGSWTWKRAVQRRWRGAS